MSTHSATTRAQRRRSAELRRLTGVLATTLALAACGRVPAPDDGTSESGTAEPSPTTTAAPPTATASTTSASPTDEIPALPGDGVNERFLPDENLLGRLGWSLTGDSTDLTEPLYRHPCSPASAVEEWSDPLSNVGRVWDVLGFNVPSLPAPPGEIGIDLYGYNSPEDADAAFSHYAGALESCGETGPGGTLDEVIGDVDTTALSETVLSAAKETIGEIE